MQGRTIIEKIRERRSSVSYWDMEAKGGVRESCTYFVVVVVFVNPLNDELNPICHLLALLGTQHILHVSSVRFMKETG